MAFAVLFAASSFLLPASPQAQHFQPRPPPSNAPVPHISSTPAAKTPASTRPDATLIARAVVSSGRAEFTLPEGLPSRSARFQLHLDGASVFLRSVTLIYGNSRSRRIEQPHELHRLASSGEELLGIEPNLDGMPLNGIRLLAAPGSHAEILLIAVAAPEQTRSRAALPPLVASATVRAGAAQIDLSLGRHIGPLQELTVRVRNGSFVLRSARLLRYGAETLQMATGDLELSETSEPFVIRLRSPEELRSLSLERPHSLPARSAQSATVVEVRAHPVRTNVEASNARLVSTGGWKLAGTLDVIKAPLGPVDLNALRVRLPIGKIKALRLASQRHAVTLIGLDFLLPDGSRQRMSMNTTITPGQRVDPIRLSSDLGQSVALEIKPLLPPALGSDAAIEVWVQQ